MILLVDIGRHKKLIGFFFNLSSFSMGRDLDGESICICIQWQVSDM